MYDNETSLIDTYWTETETDNKTERKCIRKPNFTNIMKGNFELLKDIVNGKLSVKSYSNVANTYI
jgi:hypothetical protein